MKELRPWPSNLPARGVVLCEERRICTVDFSLRQFNPNSDFRNLPFRRHHSGYGGQVGPKPTLRIDSKQSRRKLELTSLRLSEIAEQCGFASSDVMTRRFRFHLKVKPLDYRARFRSSIGPGKSLRKGHPPTKGSPKIPGRCQQGDVSYRSNDRLSPE
jgi:hypothetical protein